MTIVAVVSMRPGPLADVGSGEAARLVHDLDQLAAAAPRALLLDARDGAGAREPRFATPVGSISDADVAMPLKRPASVPPPAIVVTLLSTPTLRTRLLKGSAI